MVEIKYEINFYIVEFILQRTFLPPLMKFSMKQSSTSNNNKHKSIINLRYQIQY